MVVFERMRLTISPRRPVVFADAVARVQAGGLAALRHALHVRPDFLHGDVRRLLWLPVSAIGTLSFSS